MNPPQKHQNLQVHLTGRQLDTQMEIIAVCSYLYAPKYIKVQIYVIYMHA